jgi:hypothetical protein
MTVVGTPFDGDLSKDFVAAAIRQMLKAEKAISYSFLSEAWMAHESADHPIGLAPSDRMDRREIVMINAADRKESKFRSWEIIRGPDGVITELKANALPNDFDRFEGRFINLLAS